MTDTRPLASGAFVEICIACLCNNQNIGKTAAMLIEILLCR